MKIQEHEKAHIKLMPNTLLPQISKLLADNAKMFGNYLGAIQLVQDNCRFDPYIMPARQVC